MTFTAFNSPDTIFHYCKTSTALDYILKDGRIRLSPRRDSIDPFESKSTRYNTLRVLKLTEGLVDGGNEVAESLSEIKNELMRIEASFRQVCFCENNFHQNSNSLDYMGYLKPRMWDQYGENYKGICLAFSKNALITSKTIETRKSPSLCNQVSYVRFHEIKNRDKSINIDKLQSLGPEKLLKKAIENLNNWLFEKHVDYKDENEFRIASFTQCEYDYIDIRNSLKGIVIGVQSDLEVEKKLFDLSTKEYNVPIYETIWENHGPTLRILDDPLNRIDPDYPF